jgi:UPF0755 protein
MRAVLLLALLLAGVALDVRTQLLAPLTLEAPRTVEVPRGVAFGSLLRDWEREGLLASTRQRLYLLAHARLTGQARSIKAGEYELSPGLRAIDLTALLVSGRAVLHQLLVVEGWRFEQMLQAVRAHPAIRQTMPAATPAELMAALGRPGLHPEGRFYPDTYRFARGSTELAVLQHALVTQERILSQEWQSRAPELPYASPDEALIMASIVERETAVAEERGEIAGVFVRRLQKGMRLQTDPTVIYGLGAAFDGNLRKRDLLADTPYNTYTRRGLPPTPICLPGRAAVHAALNPAAGKTLYFVSRGDGSHQFSETLAEHEQAVRKYQLRRRR